MLIYNNIIIYNSILKIYIINNLLFNNIII